MEINISSEIDDTIALQITIKYLKEKYNSYYIDDHINQLPDYVIRSLSNSFNQACSKSFGNDREDIIKNLVLIFESLNEEENELFFKQLHIDRLSRILLIASKYLHTYLENKEI